MNPHITKALEHLQNAYYVGYFDEMDKVAIPNHLKPLFAELKSKFMQGLRTFEFSQQLEVIAKEVSKHLGDNTTVQTSASQNVLAYNTKNIYNLLNACYNDEALTMFCTFNFEKVAENFSTSMNKNQKIMALLDYTKRQMQTEQLLSLIQTEFPQQYDQHKPYC